MNSVALMCEDGDWVESKDQDPSGKIRLIQLADIGDGCFIDKSSRFMNLETAKRLNCTFLNKDDILIARMPDPIGRCCLFPFDESEKYVTVVDVAVLRLTNDCSKRYVNYMLNSPQIRHDIEGQVTGTTRKRITRKKLEKLQIHLPPLAEQKKIADILDAADQLRQKDQQLIDHYTALSQSLFLDMFGDPVSNPMGWEVGTLDDYCLKITDGTHQSPEFLSEGVPFLLVSNIVKNQIVFDTKKFVSETTYCQLTKSTPIEMGDLLYTSVGSYGNPAIVNTERKFCFQRHIAHLKPDSHKIHFRFLHGLLQSEYVKRQADRLARGVAQKTLNLKAIKSYEVFCPPLSVQMEYSNRVLSIESQQKQSLINSMRSNDLFNSLLQRAFKGELTSSKAA